MGKKVTNGIWPFNILKVINRKQSVREKEAIHRVLADCAKYYLRTIVLEDLDLPHVLKYGHLPTWKAHGTTLATKAPCERKPIPIFFGNSLFGNSSLGIPIFLRLLIAAIKAQRLGA